jgi:hypothetical protein
VTLPAALQVIRIRLAGNRSFERNSFCFKLFHVPAAISAFAVVKQTIVLLRKPQIFDSFSEVARVAATSISH